MFQILHGDVRDQLKKIESGSIQTCVTSPPYWGLRDYGTDHQVWGGDSKCDHVWETERTSRPNSSGGRASESNPYAKKLSIKGQDNYSEFADYSDRATYSDFCQKCGAWRGELGLEPTPELFVDHLVEVFREVKRVLRDDGTIWVNLGDTYWGGGWRGTSLNEKSGDLQKGHTGTHCGESMVMGTGKHDLYKPKDLVGIPWMTAFALRADGWWLRSDIIWHKPAPLPESVLDRPTKAHEYIFLMSKSQRYFYDREAIRETPKESSGKNIRCPDYDAESGERREVVGKDYDVIKGANKRSVWTVQTQPFSGAHFATFPTKLIEPCILAGSRKGDVVLDPFAGSGTTLWVAEQNGRDSVGIELNPEYVQIIKKRMDNMQINIFMESSGEINR